MKQLLFLVSLSFFAPNIFAQQATDTTETDSPKSSLTLGAVYANNASYYGQKSAEATPYAALAATYRFKSGFYLSGLAYKLLNDKTSGISASSLGAGINFMLSKRLTADLSYSHSFYSAYSPMLQAGIADNASASLTYSNWLNVNLSGDAAFGKQTQDYFVTAGLSKSINLFSISSKDIVTITPSADIVAGTQRFYKTYVTKQKERDSVLGIISNPILGGGQNQGNGGSTNNTVTKTSFDILSYNFKLPLAYNRASYLVEAAYQYSILSNKVQTQPGKQNSFVTLSFYYQF